MASPQFALLFMAATVASAQLYTLDTTFKPQFPEGSHTLSGVSVVSSKGPEGSLIFVTQRGNTTIDPVLALSTNGELKYSWGADNVGMNGGQWGSHGILVERCPVPCGGGDNVDDYLRVYIDDFFNYTFTAFSATGNKLFQVGENGVPGNGTNPLQFGHLADTCAPAHPDASTPNSIFISDGDGGTANRVVALSVPYTDRAGQVSAVVPELEWATPALFNNPHGIAYHKRSGLLLVADRENAEIHLLRAKDGADRGVWSLLGTALDLSTDASQGGLPFSVRTWSNDDGSRDLLFVAMMDNPQDGKNQHIAVVDLSEFSADSGIQSKASVLQVIAINPAEYSGPHLLGVDELDGTLYAALVADAPLSTVLRFTQNK